MKNLTIINGLMLICIFLLASCQADDGLDLRDAWVGTYDATETCTDEDPIYSTLYIEKAGRSDEVFLSGLVYGINFVLTGIITDSRITFPTQTYFVRSNPDIFYEFNGTGVFVDNILDVDYNVSFCQEEPFGLNCVNQGSCDLNLLKIN